MSYDLFLVVFSFLTAGYGFLIYFLFFDYKKLKVAKKIGSAEIAEDIRDKMRVEVILLILDMFLLFWLFLTHINYVKWLFGV